MCERSPSPLAIRASEDLEEPDRVTCLFLCFYADENCSNSFFGRRKRSAHAVTFTWKVMNDLQRGVSKMDERNSENSKTKLVRHIPRTDSGTTMLVSFYEVNMNRLLGKGSYGKVCLAKKSSNGKTFACKVMDIEQAPLNFVERFLPRELEILSQLNHPNVIRVYTYVKYYSVYYLFMDHCANGDLLRYLQKKGKKGEKLSEDESREKFIQILMGTQYLHQRQIAHRDLKCENILIDGSTLKLADFGFSRFCVDPAARRQSSAHVDRTEIQSFRSRDIAVLHTSDPEDDELIKRGIRRRSRGRHSASATLARLNSLTAQSEDEHERNPSRPSSSPSRPSSRPSRPSSSAARKRHGGPSETVMKSRSFCGSVAYASPEVVAGEAYDPKISDMWSCGVILYILLMGKMPFDDSHPRKMLRRQRAKRYLEKIRTVLPELGIDLIETLLEPNTPRRSTVEGALSHNWLRPIYRKKLEQLVVIERHSRGSSKAPRNISHVSIPQNEGIPLNNPDSSGKRFLDLSVLSVHSNHSRQSGQSERSVKSAQSANSSNE